MTTGMTPLKQMGQTNYSAAKAGITLSDVSYTRPRQSTCVFYGSDTACKTL